VWLVVWISIIFNKRTRRSEEKKQTVGLVGWRDKGEGVAVTTQGKRDNENVLRTFPES
jgi:hypothetical protein